jgi:hypothetical protein
MVSAYWEQPLLQEDIAGWLGTREIGTPSSNIQRLTRLGFEVSYGEGSTDSLRTWLAQDCPVILFLRTGELPTWTVDTPHAVVLAGLHDDTAHIFDPTRR